MSHIALSTGCFAGHEARLADTRIETAELASHDVDAHDRIRALLCRQGTRVLGVHCPSPSRGPAPNLAAEGESWTRTAAAIREAVEVAVAVGADYVVVHAFYCADLPADDVARAEALRSLPQPAGAFADYVESEAYLAAKERAKRNLETLLPELPRGPTIVLENLNPRVGYGGILVDDLCEIASELDGEVGVCLDVGHLALAAAALGRELGDQVTRARDLIRVVHVHQNFGGRYFADRWWNESQPRPGLQEVDIHLPFLTRYASDGHAADRWVAADNSAFARVLEGPAVYAASSDEFVEGPVDAGELASRVEGSVPRVLELDSRYAPIDDILDEYEAARSGRHPVLSR